MDENKNNINIEETQPSGEKKPWLTLEDLEREIELPTDSIYSDNEEEEENPSEEEPIEEEIEEEPVEEEPPVEEEEEEEEKSKSKKKSKEKTSSIDTTDTVIDDIKKGENQIKRDNQIREQQIQEQNRLKESQNVVSIDDFNDTSLFEGIISTEPVYNEEPSQVINEEQVLVSEPINIPENHYSVPTEKIIDSPNINIEETKANSPELVQQDKIPVENKNTVPTENENTRVFHNTDNVLGQDPSLVDPAVISNASPKEISYEKLGSKPNIEELVHSTNVEKRTEDYKNTNLYQNPQIVNQEIKAQSHFSETMYNKNDLSGRVDNTVIDNKQALKEDFVASGIIKNKSVSSYKESAAFKNPEIINTNDNKPKSHFSSVNYQGTPLRDRKDSVPSYKANIESISVNNLKMIPNGPETKEYSVDKPFHKRAIDSGVSSSSVEGKHTTNYGAARVVKNDLEPGFSSTGKPPVQTQNFSVKDADRPNPKKTQMEVVLKQSSIKKADMGANYASSIKALKEYNALENKANSPHRFKVGKAPEPVGSSISGGAAKDRVGSQENIKDDKKSGKGAQENPVTGASKGPKTTQESPDFSTGDRKYRTYYNKTNNKNLERFKRAIGNGLVGIKNQMVEEAKQITVNQDEDYRKTKEVVSYTEIPYEMVAAIGARATFKDMLDADTKAGALAKFASKNNLSLSSLSKEQLDYLKNVTSGTNRKVFDVNEFKKLQSSGKPLSKRQTKLLEKAESKLSLQNVLRQTEGLSQKNLNNINNDVFLKNSVRNLKKQSGVFDEYFRNTKDKYLRSLGISSRTDIKKLNKLLKDKNLSADQIKVIKGLIEHKKLLNAKGNISGRVTKTLRSIKRKITGFLKRQDEVAIDGMFKVYDLGKTSVKITRHTVKAGKGAVLLGAKVGKNSYRVAKYLSTKTVDVYGKATGKTASIQTKREEKQKIKNIKKQAKELKKKTRAEKINKISRLPKDAAKKVGEKVGNTKIGKVGKKVGTTASNAGRIVSKPFKAAGGLFNKIAHFFSGIGKIFAAIAAVFSVLLVILSVLIGAALIFVMIYGNFIHAGSSAMIRVIDKEDVKALKSIVDDLDLEEELKLDEFVKGKPKLPDVLGNQLDRYGCPDDNYETGYTVKYFNGTGHEVYEISNLKDILSMVAVMMDQHFEDEDAVKALIMDLYEMSHKDEFFKYEESDIYFCSQGCDEISYKCYHMVNEAAILYNTYGTRIFNIMGCEPYLTYCDGCEIVEEEEPETFTPPSYGVVEIEPEEPSFYCPGHENPGCPGHIQKVCYGHRNVDIEITIWFMEDMIKEEMPSNSKYNKYLKEFYEHGGWSSEDHQQWAQALYEEDWYELYGINIGAAYSDSDLVSLDELTEEEIQNLVGSASGDRAAVLEWASLAVGKIPYYWYWRDFGSLNPGFEGNEFGSSTRKGRTVFPDTMGRTKYGLDCSGFVCWVFKSAGVAGISEFSNCAGLWGISRACTYDELEPGDLGFKANPANLKGYNHVGIYVGDGQWIHCTGSPVNMTVKDSYKGFKFFRKAF